MIFCEKFARVTCYLEVNTLPIDVYERATSLSHPYNIKRTVRKYRQSNKTPKCIKPTNVLILAVGPLDNSLLIKIARKLPAKYIAVDFYRYPNQTYGLCYSPVDKVVFLVPMHDAFSRMLEVI